MNGDAWMRLHVNDIDAALAEMKRHTAGLVGPDKQMGEAMRPPTLEAQKYTRAVGWDDIQRIKRPEYYAYPPQFNGTGWRADIVVDRERKLLFVEARLF